MRLLLLSLALCACGQASTSKIRLVPNVVSGVQLSTAAFEESPSGRAVDARRSALRVGTPGAVNLKSLKYFVSSIQLCQNVQLMGSGYSNTEGCIALYENQGAGAPDYDGYLVTQAKDDATAGRYIDLMTAEGQAALRRPVTIEIPTPVQANDAPNAPDGGAAPSPAGAYRFGLINFYRPIKVTAEFPIVGAAAGEYFRTRAVTAVNGGRTMDGRFNTERVQIGDTLSGPTEETTYMLNNGGALFTFQKPFVITQADIDAKTEIKVDLVFNPENFGQAYESSNCLDDPNNAICDPTNNVVIDMPFVRMNPVPRKPGERTRKETYLMDYDVSSRLRVELYYNDADEEAGIQGVDAAIVYTATTNSPAVNMVASNFVSQTGSVRTGDAAVTLMDYARSPTLTGLVRRQNGNVTVHCVHAGGMCAAPGGTVARAYSFVGDTIVSSD